MHGTIYVIKSLQKCKCWKWIVTKILTVETVFFNQIPLPVTIVNVQKLYSAQLPGNWPSVLWRCWLGDRKGIRAVKNWAVGCWHGCVSGARCRLAYGPADATATHSLLLRKIQIGFTFLLLAHLGSPVKRAVKWVCVLPGNYNSQQ